MSAELDALATQAKTNEDAEASAVTLLNNLSGLITAAAGDKAKSLQLAADLKTSADSLAAAVVANTPAA